MKRVISPIIVVGLLVVGLATLPAVGLPYDSLDWMVFSQGYGVFDNLALGQPTAASTYLAGHAPSLAVDGDPETTWESFSYHGEWFYVILDEPQWVNQVTVDWGSSYATRFQVSVLRSGHQRYWQPVYEEVGGDGDLDFATFPAVYGEAVLISMYGRAPESYNYSIAEFGVFYLPDEVQETENLAAGQPAYVSSYLTDYPPSHATDGDLSTSWRPDTFYNRNASSIYVDLGDTYDVTQVDLYWGDLYPGEYRLYAWSFVWSTRWYGYWAWWPIYDATSAGGHDTATFTPISTRYVRLVSYGQGVDLQEFEVYSGPTQPPGNSQPSESGLLRPEMTRGNLQGVLRDVTPPGWEKSPAWHQTPAKKDVPIPKRVPLESVPSIDR